MNNQKNGLEKKRFYILCFILVESMICKSFLAILISSYVFGGWGKPTRVGTRVS